MTIVALALIAALAITVTGISGLLRSQQREHNRREDLILNQLLHATGNTWQPPPADERPEPEPAQARFTPSPEHFPPD